MAQDNPFDDDYVPGTPPARMPAGEPQVPLSGNPFETGYVSHPYPTTTLNTAADALKAASNTFSLGTRDRLEGLYRRYVSGEAPTYSEGVNQAVADTQMRRERSPYVSVVGDVAGGTAQAFVPGAGVVGRTVGATLGGAGAGARAALARMTGYGLEGGIYGAAQGAGHTYSENPEDYAKNALIGGAFGGVMGAPFGHFADVAPRSLAAVPTSRELKAAASGSYSATHAVPIEYHAPNFWSGIDALEQTLLSTTNPVKSPAVWETLRLARAGRDQANQPGVTATVSPKNIDDLRQQLTGVNEPGASQARAWLDNFMQDPAGVARGTQADRDAIARLLTAARGDYRAGKRTQTIEERTQYGEDRAEVANSGRNIGNTVKQKLVALLNPNSREGRWYTPEEKQQIRAATRAEGVQDVLRQGGNILGGGGGVAAGAYGAGGLGTAFVSGDWLPAAVGAAAPAAGYLLRGASNRASVRAANELADAMAVNSPLYRAREAAAPVVAGPGLSNKAEATRNAIVNQFLNQLRLRDQMYGQE